MTHRGPEWSEAIQRLYEGGLSRRQIRISLQGHVSERFIREEYEKMTLEQTHAHKEAMKDIRARSRGFGHTPDDYARVVDSKAIGRGMRKLKNEGLLDEESAEEYWTEWHKKHPEGSP